MARGVNDNGNPIVEVSGLSAGILLPVNGNVAHDAVDTGNPQKIGGKASAAIPAAVSADGDRVDAWYTTRGAMMVALTDTAGAGPTAMTGSSADGVSPGTGPVVHTRPSIFNGVAWDRHYANYGLASILASAARTATTSSPDQTNFNARGIMLFLDVSAQPGGGETLSLKIQAKLPGGSTYVDLYDAGVLFTAATGLKGLVAYPGAVAADVVAAAVVAKSGPIPRTWRAVVTHSAAGSWTYALAGAVIL